MRNAHVGSDHNLLVAKMILKLKNVTIGMARNQRTGILTLKDTFIKEKFSIMIRNCLNIVQDETALTIDHFNTAMMEPTKETIGYTKTCKSEWTSPDTWRTIEERRQLKKKALNSKSTSLKEIIVTQYRGKDKQAKTSVRRDKRQHVERHETEAEAAAEQNDMKTVYQITRKLCRDRGQNQNITVKAKE